MRLGRRPEEKVRGKARARLKKVHSTGEIVNWCEQTLNAVHRGLEEHQRTGSAAALLDAQTGVQTLAGAIDVLQDRLPPA